METFFDLMNGNVSLANLLIAVVFIGGLQWFIGKLNTSSEPRLLYCSGMFLPRALMQAKVTEAEIREAIRSGGIHSMDQVEVVVLEANGHLSAIVKGIALGDQSLG